MKEFADLVPFVLTPFIMTFFIVTLDVLGIIALVYLIKALKIYIKKNM